MAAWTEPGRVVRRLLVGAAISLISVYAAHAGPGDHVRLGQTTLIPSVAMGVALESNPYRSPDNPRLGAHFALTPSLGVRTRAQQVHFDLDARYMLQKYFTQEQFNLDRFSNFDIGARVHVRPDGRVGFVFSDRVSLRSRNTERPGAAIAYYNHFRNHLDGTLVINAGPVLRFLPTGAWTYDEFYTANFNGDTLLKPFNARHTFGPSLRAEWDFFPMTALVLDGGYMWTRQRENWVPTGNPGSELGAFMPLPDSEAWRARIGIRGRLTRRLVLLANVGYGQARYDEQSVIDAGGDATGVDADLVDERGILAQVQLGWELGPQQEIRIGYQRDFADAWFSNYLVFDEVYGGVTLRLGTRVRFDTLVKVRFEDYFGTLERRDIMLRGQVGLGFYLRDWVSLDLRTMIDQRYSTGTRVTFQNVGGFLGATLTY